jgi:hypothetical protein
MALTRLRNKGLGNSVSFNNINDTGTEGTKVASGTTAQRGSTTGQLRFNTTNNLAEYYDGTQFKSIDSPPVVSSVNNTNIEEADITSGFDLTITGSGFASGATVKFIGADNTEYSSGTVTVNSATSITASVPTSVTNANEPYSVKVTNVSGLSNTLADAFNVDAKPVWQTTAGNILEADEGASVSTTVSATDPEGDTVSYAETGGTILTTNGFTLNSSTGAITGTAPTVTGTTTYSFDLRATSGSNFTDRTFNIIIADAPTGGDLIDTYTYDGTTYTFHKFTSNGNFVIGANKTVDIFVLGGGGGSAGDNSGGGGAGGLIFRPSLVLSSGTYAITIGQGGTGTSANSQASSTKGTNTTFGSLLTALGGGYGGSSGAAASNGGSGGGGGRYSGAGASGIQTTDSGISADSRTYGFGFNGGNGGNGGSAGSEGPGGGGGGTGANGSNASIGTVGNGGNGNSTFINSDATETTAFLKGTLSGTDSSNNTTTSSSSGTLYIGGGGSGGTQDRAEHSSGGSGGLGGGADIGTSSDGRDGQATTGSGGSSTTSGSGTGGDGGSGLVIVRFS